MAELYKIPNQHIQEEFEYLPAFLAGYNHFNYANLDDTISDSDFSDWVVGLFDDRGNEVQVFNTLVQDVISGAEFRFLFNFTISESLSGVHFFALINYGIRIFIIYSKKMNS
jgi:hypothetical protein